MSNQRSFDWYEPVLKIDDFMQDRMQDILKTGFRPPSVLARTKVLLLLCNDHSYRDAARAVGVSLGLVHQWAHKCRTIKGLCNSLNISSTSTIE